MATQKFSKIYTGTLAQIKNVENPEVGALYIATDAKVGFKNKQQILGNFLTASSVNEANIQGVLYHIPASGENPAEFGYWNGTTFVDIVKGSDIVALEQRVSNLEALHAAGKHEGKSTVAEEVAAGINALDVTEFALTSVANGVVSIYGIKEADGKVAKGENKIDLAKVASTGKAEDVEYKAESAEGAGDAESVKDALNRLDKASSVKDGDKILSQDANGISSTLSIAIEKQGEEGAQKDYIVLKGIGGVEVAKADATAFVKDGMLNSAELVVDPEGQAVGTYIKLIWNTDAKKSAMFINVTSLIDIYTGTANEIVVNENKSIALADAIKTALNSKLDSIVKSTSKTDAKGFIALDVTEKAATATSPYNVNKQEVGVQVTYGTFKNGETAAVDGVANVAAVQSELDKLDGAIKALDGSAVIATVAEGVVTIKAGVAQEDGLVKQGTGADITLAKIATTGAAADMSVAASDANGLKAGTAQATFEKLSKAVKDIQDGSVTSFAGQTGAITVDTEGTAADAVKFTVGNDKKLTGSIHYGSFAKGATEAVDGIAKVSDVAAEIAAAKAAIEGALTETDAQTLKALNNKIDAIDKTHVTVKKADGAAAELSVTPSDNAKTFTIDLTKATYTASEGVQNDTISDGGLVDGKMLRNYVEDHAIYWVEL